VFDDTGKDVTPHPLFHSVPNTVGARTYGSSLTSLSSTSTSETVLHETAEPGSRRDTTVGISDVQVRQEETEELTEEDLDRTVDIYLTETETIRILDMPSVAVSVESEDAGRVLERNKIYADICKNRAGNDRFVEKTMQTINGAAKNKEVQCDKIIMEDKGMIVTSWHLNNPFNGSETESTPKAGGSRTTTGNCSKSHTTKEHDQTMPMSSDRESTALDRIHKEEECHSEAILTSEKFQQDLFFMERILMENIFQPKLAAYRQFPVLIDLNVTTDTSGTAAALKAAQQEEHDKEKKDKEELTGALIDPSILSGLNKTPEEIVPPRPEQLWSYVCDLTQGHSVSSMAWSKVNPDLLAVGYGAFDFKDQKKGLACCWSLKNPMWPERVFRSEHGVTALDFSTASPNLLAVGMYNGSVAIYNVQSCKDTALLDSSESSNKHTGPVWQVRWVEQDRGPTGDGKKERLICISADGRVTEWFIQKRLDCTDLMKIKQRESEKKKLPSEKERRSEALILQHAAGMCFDFHPKDTDLYLAGTEEGHIHKCSSSCNEQFLETYRGHKGPVYKVAWNPFSTDMFLSCSADWSIILWHQDSQTPALTFSSTAAFVHDIMWSPKSPFIFAAANESQVEIWDLSVSILNPVISCFADPGVKFTSVLFARNTDCLLVGNSKGEVGVFELRNLAAPSSIKADLLHDIMGPAGAI
ncbi:WD repeat-containing protein 78, partial [Antrostomus carolinensis]|uniref:WD repeat-containing protein 78 n=1 Tax=Antrostomus carolinensis TaxID=279965 RepID=UPI0010A98A1B